MELELESVDCPVCGPSPTCVWLEDGKPTRYLQCDECGTVYSSPRYSKEIRHTQTGEAWAYNSDVIHVEAKRRPALKLEAELIQQHVQQGRMLDVGCSTGDFFDFFPASRWEHYGVELSVPTATSTAERLSIQVFAGTLLEAGFSSDTFDLVSMIDMFYYADNPLADLMEVKRILKPAGVLAIEIAGQAYMFARSRGLIALLMEKQWCRLSSDSHLYWFNPAGLARLLKKAGFQPFKWYVTPSPKHGNVLLDSITGLHYSLLKSLSNISFKTITWAPKFICLAHPTDDHS